MFNTTQQIAIASKCAFNFPEFYLRKNVSDEEWLKLCTLQMWEITDEDIALKKGDYNIDYVLYYKDKEFHYPIIFINDGHLLTGSMGAALPANLVSAFPGTLNITNKLNKLKDVIENKLSGYEGYITLSFSFTKKKGICFRQFEFGVLPDYLHNIKNLQKSDYFLHDLHDLKLSEPQGLSISARLYSYPYTPSYNKELKDILDTDLNLMELEECFIITHYQEKINFKEAWNSLYNNIRDPYYMHNGLVFNNDGEIKARKTYDFLRKYRLIK